MANTYSAGIVTAYGAAKRGGYTGTYEQFCQDQAGFAEAAQQVREDKESVEQTVQTFEETTVPAAVQSVTDEGTRQIGLVGNAGSTQVGNVNSAGTTQVGNVNSAGDAQVQAVADKGDETISEVEQAVADAQDAVDSLEAQKNTIAQTIASMAQLGTDTTLSTPGMAADAKATGDEFTNVKNAISQLKTLLLNDLIPILYAGVYTSDQSTAIAAFAAALSGGGGSITPSYSSGTLTLSGFESTPGWSIT